MSVTELAKAAGLSSSQHISMIESGAIARPREDRLLAIIDALNLTLPGFYGGER